MSSRAPSKPCSLSLQPWRRRRRIQHRLELLEQLAQGERSVEVLADRPGCRSPMRPSICNTCVEPGSRWPEREGKFVFYRLADDAVLDLLAIAAAGCGAQFGRGRARGAQLLPSRDSLEPVSRRELADRLKAGLVTRARSPAGGRVRPWPRAGRDQHSARRTEKRLADLEPDQEMSLTAADPTACCPSRRSRCSGARGFKARRLEDGLARVASGRIARRRRRMPGSVSF